MDQQVKVSMPVDDDGFMSQECPKCAERFKILAGQGSPEPVSCCPYCNHRDQGCWWTQDQADYLSSQVAENVLGPLLSGFAKDINKANRRGSFIQMTAKYKPGDRHPAPDEQSGSMTVVHFNCCNEKVKVRSNASGHHCIICGKSSSLTA